jgi:hypothetical protein
MAVGPPGVLGYPPPQQQPMMQPGMPLAYPPAGPMDQSQFVPQMGGAPGQPPPYMGQPSIPLQMLAMPPQQQYAAPSGAYPNGPSGNNNRPMQGNPDSYGASVYQPPPVPPNMGQPPYNVLPSSRQPPSQRGPGPGPYSGAPYPPSAPVQGGWQQPLAVDILGLADKAAYAVQALASQNRPGMPPGNTMRPPSVGYPGAPPNAYGQPPMSMPHAPGQPPMSMPHAPGQPPMSMPRAPGQPPMSMPRAPGQPPMSMSHGPGQPPMSHGPGQPPMSHGPGVMPDANGPKGARRRTTATMQELPVMVQYAVQVRTTKRLFVGNSCTFADSFLCFITPESSSH